MNQGIGNIAVEGKHIVKDFRLGATTTKVLKDISLQVMQGEFVSIMGPSGSGKSTLLYILGGLDVSTSGRVLLDGTDISVSGNEKMSRIMLPLLLDGKKMGSCKKQLERILEVTGLTDRRRHTPRELSGGQQRVAIARALIGNPEILFADEPTGNLDSRTGAGIMALLRDINQETGQTIIMVTHSQEAADSSTRMITVQDGMII